MSKIVRLTESDLIRLVKKVVKEQDDEMERRRQFDLDKGMVMLERKDADTVQKVLSNLPQNLKFLAIKDCEGADFTDVDICSFPELLFVNLRGTPNNFEDSVDCEYISTSDNMFDFSGKFFN